MELGRLLFRGKLIREGRRKEWGYLFYNENILFLKMSTPHHGGNWKKGGSGAKDSGNSRGEGGGWLIYMEFPMSFDSIRIQV